MQARIAVFMFIRSLAQTGRKKKKHEEQKRKTEEDEKLTVRGIWCVMLVGLCAYLARGDENKDMLQFRFTCIHEYHCVAKRCTKCDAHITCGLIFCIHFFFQFGQMNCMAATLRIVLH